MIGPTPTAPSPLQPSEKATNAILARANGAKGRANDAALAGRQSPVQPPSVVAVYLGAIILLLAGYTLVFELTIDSGWADAVTTALGNVLPLAAIAATAYTILKYVVLPKGVLAQACWHVALAPAFALSWYGLVLTMLAIINGIATGHIEMGSFSGIAFVWQMFQGLVLYALVAATSYALQGGRVTVPVHIVQAPTQLARYLTKQGDELIPVAVQDIVSIRGAQDYSEVCTVDTGTHLVRMSLAEFEKRLPADSFVRVHRSTIINIAHLGRAEPIGAGRMAIHLAGGQMVEASRTGSQALRNLVL
jgi:two-component system, LytTR family, response regulator